SESSINAYLADTIAAVFPYIYTVDVPGTTNRELFASQHADMLPLLEAHEEVLTDDALRSLMQEVRERVVSYEAGEHLLTDDQAPVELLGMEVIDSLIQNELGYYKERFRQDGISGILGDL
ncbi:MAG: spermidine synthase, partial [Lachnospiraceae bacterium]|nr:spermidine synthase [Lachnospiraceae bacterium]